MSRPVSSPLKHSLFSLLFFALFSAGCARLPVEGTLAPGLEVESLAAVLPGSPFAWAPDGERIALVDGQGLKIRHLDTGSERRLIAGRPTSLAWDGAEGRLAAAFVEGEESRIRIFADGRIEREIELPGEVDHLVWRDGGELLAMGIEIERFSFGANFRQVLYRWRGESVPEAQKLHDVTLKLLTLHQWGGRLARLPRLELSPWGDEIVYLRLHDPPEFPPYLKIVLRHLDTGVERVIGEAAPSTGGAVFSPGGDAVIFGDGIGKTVELDPWTGEEKTVGEFAGGTLTRSPGGASLFIDGELRRAGHQVAAFPSGSEGRFAPRGDRLLIRYRDHLYLLEGLAEDRAPVVGGEDLEALLRLRRWRSQGLITHQEYLLQRKRMNQP